MNHRPFTRYAALLTLALSPLYACAAGTATIETDGESSTIAWLNNSTIRVDMPFAYGGYMVARDGKIYMVSTNSTGGMPPVMEIGGMMQGFAAMGNKAGGDSAGPLAKDVTSIKATGKKETVAGIDGEVYELTTTDQQGHSQTLQAVFTDDPLVVEMTAAYLAFSEAMVGPKVIADFKSALPKSKRGLLRVGDEMVLQSIAADPPSASVFELPAKPMNIGDMMKDLMKQLQ